MADADTKKKTCFIAMPIRTRPEHLELYGDPDHWRHVMASLLEPALRLAGYEPIAPTTKGSQLIHATIIDQLIHADMVLADLSSLNPNVLYELGVRTSLNFPLVVIADEHTMGQLPFDTLTINTHEYKSSLPVWEIEAEREKLREHVEASSGPGNPMWRHFGLQLTAAAPSVTEDPREAKLDLLTEQVERLLVRQDATVCYGSVRREVERELAVLHRPKRRSNCRRLGICRSKPGRTLQPFETR